VPTLIQSVIYIVIVYAVCRIVRLIFNARMKNSLRAKTVFSLLDGFVKYACAIAIIILILKACGVNTTALIASVGVLTLIVGLGAQPLIADIIAGIFIIFEDEYHVGEIVTINDFRGTVMEIGIRSTKLLDAAGNIKIINNSAIGDVINLSRELSLAVVDCDFPYDVPVEFIEKLLKDNFDDIAKRIPEIKEGPFYKGVCMFKDSNVTIKIVAQCLEEDRFQVERDLNREYRRLLTENGIDIAFPQVVINYPQEKQFTVSKKDKREANEFAEEQSNLSKNIEEQDS
jgi:small conductance mechanosensitive channel